VEANLTAWASGTKLDWKAATTSFFIFIIELVARAGGSICGKSKREIFSQRRDTMLCLKVNKIRLQAMGFIDR